MFMLINSQDNAGLPDEKFCRRSPRSIIANSMHREIKYCELMVEQEQAVFMLGKRKGNKDNDLT